MSAIILKAFKCQVVLSVNFACDVKVFDNFIVVSTNRVESYEQNLKQCRLFWEKPNSQIAVTNIKLHNHLLIAIENSLKYSDPPIWPPTMLGNFRILATWIFPLAVSRVSLRKPSILADFFPSPWVLPKSRTHYTYKFITYFQNSNCTFRFCDFKKEKSTAIPINH